MDDLYRVFVPIVELALRTRAARCRISIVYIGRQACLNLAMYEMCIEPEGPSWRIDEIMDIARCLMPFCTREKYDVVSGRRYLIGDGDGDPSAVTLRNNAFRIWLRTWEA